jgi:cation transport ATPase
VEGRSLLLGNLRLMKQKQIAVGTLDRRHCASRMKGNPAVCGTGWSAAGLLAVADTVKQDSAQAIGFCGGWESKW